MISIYAEFARDVAAMPVMLGRKSRLESFAGADCTYTIEAMMGDKRALQVLALLPYSACNVQACGHVTARHPELNNRWLVMVCSMA